MGEDVVVRKRADGADSPVPQPRSDASVQTCAPRIATEIRDPSPARLTEGVARFREWLGSVDVSTLTDRDRVQLVAELERVKGAASAAQARSTDAYRCSRERRAPRDVARSVGSEMALARRESPSLGDRLVGLSRALVHEMPHTMQALTAG